MELLKKIRGWKYFSHILCAIIGACATHLAWMGLVIIASIGGIGLSLVLVWIGVFIGCLVSIFVFQSQKNS